MDSDDSPAVARLKFLCAQNSAGGLGQNASLGLVGLRVVPRRSAPTRRIGGNSNAPQATERRRTAGPTGLPTRSDCMVRLVQKL